MTAGRFIPPSSSGVERPQKPKAFALCWSSTSSLVLQSRLVIAFAAQHFRLERHHLLADEIAGGVADGAFFVGKREIHDVLLLLLNIGVGASGRRR